MEIRNRIVKKNLTLTLTSKQKEMKMNKFFSISTITLTNFFIVSTFFCRIP